MGMTNTATGFAAATAVPVKGGKTCFRRIGENIFSCPCLQRSETDQENSIKGFAGQFETAGQLCLLLLVVMSPMDPLRGFFRRLHEQILATRLSYESRLGVGWRRTPLRCPGSRLGSCADSRLATAKNIVHARAGTRVLTSRVSFLVWARTPKVLLCRKWNAKWHDARWLEMNRPMHILLLELSTGDVVKARSVTRRPESEYFPSGDQFLSRMASS